MGGWMGAFGQNALLNPSAGAVDWTTTNPGFNAARTPNTARPTLVIAQVSIACAAGESGTVLVKLNGAAGTQLTAVKLDTAAVATETFAVTFLVPANMSYYLASTVLVGAPTFTLDRVAELTL